MRSCIESPGNGDRTIPPQLKHVQSKEIAVPPAIPAQAYVCGIAAGGCRFPPLGMLQEAGLWLGRGYID